MKEEETKPPSNPGPQSRTPASLSAPETDHTRIQKGCLALQVARRQRKPDGLAGAPNGLLGTTPCPAPPAAAEMDNVSQGARRDSLVMAVFPRLAMRSTEQKAALRFGTRGRRIGSSCDWRFVL